MRIFMDGATRGKRWVIGSYIRNTKKLQEKSYWNQILEYENKCPKFIEFYGLSTNKSFEKKRFTIGDFNKNKLFSDRIKSSILEIVNSFGITTTYSVNKHKKNELECSINFGSTFAGKSTESYFKTKTTNVIIADAFIENISEIDRIINETLESKFDTLIICRGASNDVLNTIKINRLRSQNFRLNIVLIPLELNTVNSLLDLAVICRTDVISTYKGDLMSTKGLSSSGPVDSVEYINGKLQIVNKNNYLNIVNHKNDIMTRLSESDTFGEDLLSSRAKQIGPYVCNVYLPEQWSEYDLEEFDSCLRWLSNCCRYGCFEVEGNVFSYNAIECMEQFNKTLSDLDTK